MQQNPHVLLTFDKVHNPFRLPRKTTSAPPKSGAKHVVFCTFSLRNVLRATTAALFRHLNFKSAPKLVCFIHFDLEPCFAPQRRALFRHLNVQKWSEAEVLCTF